MGLQYWSCQILPERSSVRGDDGPLLNADGGHPSLPGRREAPLRPDGDLYVGLRFTNLITMGTPSFITIITIIYPNIIYSDLLIQLLYYYDFHTVI